jgi:rsbT antagonist protein RsbS
MGDGRFVITRLNQTMVATLEGAVDAGELGDVVNSVSEVQARQNVNSVAFDVSACDVMDLDEFAELQRAIRTVEWLGLRCVVVGLRPGIVAYIVSSGVELGTLRTALDLELALEELSANCDEQEPEQEPEAQQADEFELGPESFRSL